VAVGLSSVGVRPRIAWRRVESSVVVPSVVLDMASTRDDRWLLCVGFRGVRGEGRVVRWLWGWCFPWVWVGDSEARLRIVWRRVSSSAVPSPVRDMALTSDDISLLCASFWGAKADSWGVRSLCRCCFPWVWVVGDLDTLLRITFKSASSTGLSPVSDMALNSDDSWLPCACFGGAVEESWGV